MFTKECFINFYKDSPDPLAIEKCYDAVYKSLLDMNILTDLTLIGALATIRTEVGRNFKPIEEYADGSAYEGKKDLGNCLPGFGKLFKGRGYIQLTGFANYYNYGKSLGIDLVCHPELALTIENSAKILALYFRNRGCNTACDSKNWTQVRKLVNGGTNGLDVFLRVVNDYSNKL